MNTASSSSADTIRPISVSMRGRATLGRQDGFTLVELMAAALVLVIGMLAVLTVLNTGVSKTTLNRQRVGATNLARELTEAARIANYQRLAPATIAQELQLSSASLESSSAAEWTVTRENATYTIQADVCAFDDPADQLASVVPDNRCANNPTGANGDLNGDDFRRLTVQVNWVDREGDPTTFQQTTLIANPAGGIGPRILTFPQAADVGPGQNTANFSLTSTISGAIGWNADDGLSNGVATRTDNTYTKWAISWPLGPVGSTDAVLDGTYLVTAQALDDRGIAGDTKVSTVRVNRSLPFAPRGFVGGRNTRVGDWVDLEWNLNSERDIIGYRVFWAGADNTVGTGDDVRVCPGTGAPSDRLSNDADTCTDTSGVSGAGAARFYIYAIDSSTPDPTGERTTLDIKAANARPDGPQALVVSGADEATLDWSPPAGGGIAFYRIYRGGTGLEHRTGRTTESKYVDFGATAGADYFVTAVDEDFNESEPIGPVRWLG